MYLHIFLFIEMSETLTNNTTADQASIGTFNDEQSADRVENSNVNMDTFMEELDSLVDQPIANDDSSIIENGHNNNNREDEPKKVETKNVDIDEFLGELDSLVDVEHPELVLEPVLMTELEIVKQDSEMSLSETLTNNTATDQASITTDGTFNDELIPEKVVNENSAVTEQEPFLEVPPVTIDELVVNPSESLSEPAEQDVVDCSKENFKSVQENFPTVSSSSPNGLENTKIKDGKLYLPAIYLDSQTNKKLSRPIYRRWRPAVCEFEFGAFLCCMFYYL